MEKAPGNKAAKRCKWYGKGKQALFPVKQVITDHGADIAFVYTGTAFHDSRKVMAAFCLARGFGLVWGRNVGIRDKEGRRACVFLHSVQNTRMMRMRTGPAGVFRVR